MHQNIMSTEKQKHENVDAAGLKELTKGLSGSTLASDSGLWEMGNFSVLAGGHHRPGAMVGSILDKRLKGGTLRNGGGGGGAAGGGGRGRRGQAGESEDGKPNRRGPTAPSLAAQAARDECQRNCKEDSNKMTGNIRCWLDPI